MKFYKGKDGKKDAKVIIFLLCLKRSFWNLKLFKFELWNQHISKIFKISAEAIQDENKGHQNMQTSEFLHLLGHFRVPLVAGTSSKGDGTTRRFRGYFNSGVFSLGLGGGVGCLFSRRLFPWGKKPDSYSE